MKHSRFLTFALVVLSLLQTGTGQAAGLTYDFPQYPYTRDLSQTLVYRIMLRCALPEDRSNMDMQAVATYMRKVDCITRGIPKVVVLGGYQMDGHDHTYPAWLPADDDFTAPGRRKGYEALLWLMEEAKKYNTYCTFHVNPFDAYEDSPVWDDYVEKDLLCRTSDGSLVKGDVWWGRQSYFVNLVREWNAGVTQQKIDSLMAAFPLIQETGVLYFDNQTQYPESPKHRTTKEDEITAIKRVAQYLKEQYGVQLIGEYADPQLYGFASTGITWDWNASLNVVPMETPAYILCGGRNLTHDNLLGQTPDLTKRQLQVFGSSVQLEDIQFQDDVSKVLREFTHHTLTYFYMNRLLRMNLEQDPGYEMELTLSDSVVSRFESDNKHRLYRDGHLMKDDYDVFIPVYWVNHPEIMAYSLEGGERTWHFPREWNDVQAVDMYKFNSTYLALGLAQTAIPITDHTITLNLTAGEGCIIVPTGTALDNGTIYDNAPAGTATFVREDRTTGGNWTDRYGAAGYDLFGAESQLPDHVSVNYIGDVLEVLDENSTRQAALKRPGTDASRIEAVRTSELHQIIDLQLEEEQAVSLYLADYNDANCQMLVEVIEPETKQVMHAQVINTLTDGVYLTYNLNGHVQFRLTRFFYDGYRGRNGYGPSGNPGYPVCSGVFFDAKAPTGEEVITAPANRLACYLDPASGQLTINAEVYGASTADVRLHSPAGALLYHRTHPVDNHRLHVVLPPDEWSAGHGVYIASLLAGTDCLNEKIIY